MALTTGNKYLASEFNALKARVKAEMERRQYNGSMTTYSDTSYDYTVIPAADNLVLTEHMNKLVEPLNAINATGMTTVKVNDPIKAIQALNSFLTTAEQYSLTSSTTDCKSSCSGLCTTGCGNTCTGCSGTCETECTGSCLTGCSGCSGCGGDCKGACWSCKGCSGGCSGCAGSCKGTCNTSCSGCKGTCSAACRSSVRAGNT